MFFVFKELVFLAAAQEGNSFPFLPVLFPQDVLWLNALFSAE
jgi:hypothetical protein